MDYGRQVVGTRIQLDEAGFPREVPDMEPVGGEWCLIRMPPIPQLVDEFGGYELMDKKLVQDCVMSVALAVGSFYDGSRLDLPVPGGLYGGGGPMTESMVGTCAVCKRFFPTSEMPTWHDTLLGHLVEGCTGCYQLRMGAGVAA